MTMVVGSLAARDYKGVGNQYVNEGKVIVTSTDRHAVAFTTEQTPKYNEDVALTLTKGSPSGGGQPQAVATTMAVRRLTPLECERLMGWPDGWTATKADGTPQSDTHRYKQCGNGVASPVAQWIGEILIATDTATATDAGATD
jgi:DNA (cytosine-5)-methyltransferase 1